MKTAAALAFLPVLGLALGVAAGEPAAAPEPKPPEAAAKPELAASVLRLSGTAEFRRSGGTELQTLEVKTDLFNEDFLRTGPRSAVELKLADDTLLTLGAESSMVVRTVRTKTKPDETLLDLEGGLLGVTVNRPLAGRQRFEISTPVAVCGVRGTRFVVLHEPDRRGRGRGRTRSTVGTGKVNVRCLNPIFAGQPGLNLGRNESVWVTWDGFASGAKPQPVDKRILKRLMGALPGWVPDPADPSLALPLLHGDGDGGGGGAPVRGGRVLGASIGAYDTGPGGFHGAAGRAILGRLGMSGGSPMSRMLGAQLDATGSGPGTQDPVNPVIVRPGQPLQLESVPEPVAPPEPPPPPPPPPIDNIIPTDNVVNVGPTAGPN